MSFIAPHPISHNPEPPHPLMARLLGCHNPGTDDRAEADHYPILSLHWPNFQAPVTEAERTAA